MSDWKKDEDTLDELLNQMPKFTDQRSKEDVYNRVRLEVEAQVKEEKRQITRVSFAKWMPFIVSVASVILLTFLVSSYLDGDTVHQESSSNDLAEEKSTEDSMRKMGVDEDNVLTNDKMESEATEESVTMSSIVMTDLELVPLTETNSVYENNINGGTVFHFSFLENAYSIPVTIIIPKEQMDIDFPNMTPNSLEIYNRYANLIDEEALGFEDYHPYKGFFIAEGNILEHYLPEGHGYDTASGTSVPYWTSLNEIFTDFDLLARLNEDGTPIVWDQLGTLDEPSPLIGLNGRYYHKYVALNGETYLTSNVNTVPTIYDAFVQMKKKESDLYFPVIPNEATYSYREDNGKAIIHFEEPLDLEIMDSSDATLMIEAFALTAASFGTEVKLENVVQQEWLGFDLTKFLPVPLGPNGFIMHIK